MIIGCFGIAIPLAIFLDLSLHTPSVVEAKVDSTIEVEQPREVRLKVVIDWSNERIEQEIRDTFPEEPELALQIAQCESGIKMVQSNMVQPYGREESYGIFQVHARDWDGTAKKLGLEEYKTDIGQNIKLARHIYEQAGKRWTPWSCYKMI